MNPDVPNVTWAQVRPDPRLSYHIVRTAVKMMTGFSKAYCGQLLGTEPVDDRPQGKTCERCYRIVGPR